MDKRLFLLLNMAQHRLFRFMNSESERRLGISVTHVAALLFIAKNEGCRQKELAKELGLNKPAITGLANRMEKQGLINRKPCKQDGRATRIYLSDRSGNILPSVGPLIEEMNTKLASEFSEEEIEVVVRFLKSVKDTFK